MMDEAYALYGYHDMVRVDPRPPPSYAVGKMCACAGVGTGYDLLKIFEIISLYYLPL